MRRFLVDAMLGKLALWLRLTGNDTFYDTEVHDDELLIIAKDEDRILLTSDEELFERAQNDKLEATLLRGTVDEEVVEVFMKYGITPEVNPSIARCSKCNGGLTELSGEGKEIIKHHVYEQTYHAYEVFWFCNDCEAVYFLGGHWTNMVEYMDRIKQLIELREDDSS
jgi:uncharacterized protein with PIN domain